jgi:glutamine amidotransferase
MQRVAIIDYGSGNLHSAAKAFERASRESEANAKIEVTSDPKIVAEADRVVLPGVGAFADCKRGLESVAGMSEALELAVHGRGKPFLGICVGMQLLATRGLEFEVSVGLNWIAGEVRAIEPNDASLKIPHMGWNTLTVLRPHALLEEIPTGPQGLHAYFVHSFHLVASDKSAVVAQTEYGGPVTAIVAKENVAGTQFHPEKSQTLGLKFLANFLNWRP